MCVIVSAQPKASPLLLIEGVEEVIRYRFVAEVVDIAVLVYAFNGDDSRDYSLFLTHRRRVEVQAGAGNVRFGNRDDFFTAVLRGISAGRWEYRDGIVLLRDPGGSGEDVKYLADPAGEDVPRDFSGRNLLRDARYAPDIAVPYTSMCIGTIRAGNRAVFRADFSIGRDAFDAFVSRVCLGRNVCRFLYSVEGPVMVRKDIANLDLLLVENDVLRRKWSEELETICQHQVSPMRYSVITAEESVAPETLYLTRREDVVTHEAEKPREDYTFHWFEATGEKGVGRFEVQMLISDNRPK
jgi:hypothetical protein